MSDGRRRQWIAVDVFFYSSDLAQGLWSEFGIVGVVVFDAFLRACKTALVEGQVTYSTPANFLAAVGLPPVDFRNDAGDNWTLDELWKWLGSHHMTAKRARNGRTTVVARRWDEWQNRRQAPKNASKKERDTAHYKDSDKDKDITPPTPPDSKKEKQERVEACGRCVNGWREVDGVAVRCEHTLRVVS